MWKNILVFLVFMLLVVFSNCMGLVAANQDVDVFKSTTFCDIPSSLETISLIGNSLYVNNKLYIGDNGIFHVNVNSVVYDDKKHLFGVTVDNVLHFFVVKSDSDYKKIKQLFKNGLDFDRSARKVIMYVFLFFCFLMVAYLITSKDIRI